MDTEKIKYLCCKGGGVRICAYAGAAKALEEKGILQKIEGITGTSAGGIFAFLIALGYTAKEIEDIILGYDFKKFEDKTIGSILFSINRYGYCKGDYFLKVIKKHLKEKTGSENTTFWELKSKGFKDLRVFATKVDSPEPKTEFSYIKTPNVSVTEAMRATMSIPGMFVPATITGEDQLYVDGGLVNNFPINTFDHLCKCNSDEVLGLFLYNDPKKEIVRKLNYGHPFRYVSRVFKSSLKAQDINFFNDYEDRKRTVILDTLGISSTEFDISNADKRRLFASGYNCIIANM